MTPPCTTISAMAAAALIISCAAIAVNAYQLYWLRRLRAAARELRQVTRD